MGDFVMSQYQLWRVIHDVSDKSEKKISCQYLLFFFAKKIMDRICLERYKSLKEIIIEKGAELKGLSQKNLPTKVVNAVIFMCTPSFNLIINLNFKIKPV